MRSLVLGVTVLLNSPWRSYSVKQCVSCISIRFSSEIGRDIRYEIELLNWSTDPLPHLYMHREKERKTYLTTPILVCLSDFKSHSQEHLWQWICIWKMFSAIRERKKSFNWKCQNLSLWGIMGAARSYDVHIHTICKNLILVSCWQSICLPDS